MGKDLKSLSKEGYNTDSNSLEAIKVSCLMRIADAAELMAKNYQRMQDDLDYYQKRHREQQAAIQGRDNTIRTLRGHATRLKNKSSKP